MSKDDHRAKDGVAGLHSGDCFEISVRLSPSHVRQLDWLACQIRGLSGRWITRSGIVAAIIEAAAVKDKDH